MMKCQKTYRNECGTEITIQMKTRFATSADIDEAVQLIHTFLPRFHRDALNAADAVKEDDHTPICPVCGAACAVVYYRDRYHDIVGCNRCISLNDASEEPECRQ